MNDFKMTSCEMDKITYYKYNKTLKMVENVVASPVTNFLQLLTCVCVVTDSGSIQVHI